MFDREDVEYVPWDTTVIEYIAKSRGIEKSEIELLSADKKGGQYMEQKELLAAWWQTWYNIGMKRSNRPQGVDLN